MPKRTDIKSILILGAGPIVIGQACEFDYSGAQACKALREEGYRVILVNSNPATIMTDPVMADATYIEPITWKTVAKIIEKEQPDALLPTMGGQTALNCALDLEKHGVLAEHGVEMIGANADTINTLIEAGKLVPNEIVVALLKNAMETVTRTTGKTNFLLDGFPRSLNNLDAWYEIFGREAELPEMLYFECPYEVLEKRILGRAKFSGRKDDNVESMKLRFDTFKAETLPTVELFQSKKKCTIIDTSQDRAAVYAVVKKNLAEDTDAEFLEMPLSEHSEKLLGLRPWK